jgi:hypothetical protein
LLLVGCRAELGSSGQSAVIDASDGQQTQQADAAASRPDARPVDASTMGGTDAGGGATIPTAACMAKGYATSGTLTSLYRTGSNKQWFEAHAECNADVPGSTHLVVLSSQAEVSYVLSRLGWVGLYDNNTNVFVNVTKEPNDLRPFSSGQPDNGGGDENCVQMKSDGLDDDQCDNDHDYICECDGRAPVPY